jgi:hypothetical protein
MGRWVLSRPLDQLPYSVKPAINSAKITLARTGPALLIVMMPIME